MKFAESSEFCNFVCLGFWMLHFVNQPQECESGGPSPSRTRTSGQSRNDARVLSFAKNRVSELEQELKSTRAELELLRSRPSFATQREEYVLGEMDHINRQLECEFMTPFLLKKFSFACIMLWTNNFGLLQVLCLMPSRKVGGSIDSSIMLLRYQLLAGSIFIWTRCTLAHLLPWRIEYGETTKCSRCADVSSLAWIARSSRQGLNLKGCFVWLISFEWRTQSKSLWCSLLFLGPTPLWLTSAAVSQILRFDLLQLAHLYPNHIWSRHALLLRNSSIAARSSVLVLYWI